MKRGGGGGDDGVDENERMRTTLGPSLYETCTDFPFGDDSSCGPYGGTSTVYVFSGSEVIAEYDNGAAPASPSREYIYTGSQLTAKIEAGATKSGEVLEASVFPKPALSTKGRDATLCANSRASQYKQPVWGKNCDRHFHSLSPLSYSGPAMPPKHMQDLKLAANRPVDRRNATLRSFLRFTRPSLSPLNLQASPAKTQQY